MSFTFQCKWCNATTTTLEPPDSDTIPCPECRRSINGPEGGIRDVLKDMSELQLEQAFANVGVDFNCGACAENFFCGGGSMHRHTCELHKPRKCGCGRCSSCIDDICPECGGCGYAGGDEGVVCAACNGEGDRQ